MPYLNHPYENSFKELCASMPLFYLDVYEMREILKVHGRLADELRASTERVISNEFILLADEETVTLWEGMLGITYNTPISLDERKAVIMGHIFGYAHIGEPEIREIIALYTDSKVFVAFSKGIITIEIDGFGIVPAYTNLVETICKRIPAHLALKFTVNIRSPTPATLYLGGGIGAQPSIGIPLEPDAYDFQDTLHLGGSFGTMPEIGIPNEQDSFRFQDTLHAGGPVSSRVELPVPEDTAQPTATTILRTGGVCTIISNLSRGD